MAFNSFIPKINNIQLGTGITASLRKRKDSPAKLILIFKSEISDKLGVSLDKPVKILLGDGADHGMVRLENDAESSINFDLRQTAKGQWFELNLGPVEQFVDEKQAKLNCQWEKLSSGDYDFLEVVLPSWAEHTAPKQPSTKQMAVDKAKANIPAPKVS